MTDITNTIGLPRGKLTSLSIDEPAAVCTPSPRLFKTPLSLDIIPETQETPLSLKIIPETQETQNTQGHKL